MIANVVSFDTGKAINQTHEVRVFKEVIAKDFFDARVKLVHELGRTKIELKVLAEVAELSQQTVSRMKHGETFEPRGKTLVNLYKALGIRLIFE